MGSLVALSALFSALAPAYVPSVHGRIDRAALSFALGEGAQLFLDELHFRADDRTRRGEKYNGRLYLHFIAPIFDFTPSAHAVVRGSLGLPPAGRATARDFVEVSTRRAIAFLGARVQRSRGALSEREAGELLFVLGVLLHAVQDEKHLEGNWSLGQDEAPTALAHGLWEMHQTFSDLWPSEASLGAAVARSSELWRRVRAGVAGVAGERAAALAFAAAGAFSMPPGRAVRDYRPSRRIARYLFPIYSVNNGIDP